MKKLFDWKDWLTIAAMAVIVGLASVLPNPVEAHENLEPEVVEYYQQNAWIVSDRSGFGTAWPVYPGFYVTNKHVTGGVKSLVMFNDYYGDEVACDLVQESALWDLAMIYCPELEEYPQTMMQITPYEFPIGTATHGGGYGKGEFGVHEGHLMGWRGRMRMTTTFSINGDSGSAEIVWDNGPVLVGVRTAGLQHAAGVAALTEEGGWEIDDNLLALSSLAEKNLIIPNTTVLLFLEEVDFDLTQ